MLCLLFIINKYYNMYYMIFSEISRFLSFSLPRISGLFVKQFGWNKIIDSSQSAVHFLNCCHQFTITGSVSDRKPSTNQTCSYPAGIFTISLPKCKLMDFPLKPRKLPAWNMLPNRDMWMVSDICLRNPAGIPSYSISGMKAG